MHTNRQRIPCGILKSRRSSRRASAIASTRQIKICIWDGLGFDDDKDDDDDDGGGGGSSDDDDDDNGGGVTVGFDAEFSASSFDLPLSVEDSCSCSTSCAESEEGFTCSMSEEALLRVALLDSSSSTAVVLSSSSLSEMLSGSLSPVDDLISSTNAATSKDSLTSHIAAIILSISTVMMEILPLTSLMVDSTSRSSVALFAPSESC